jgi:2-oxoglutarate dehydrogenase complex dehydrogenase (E1) component-like enzyme
MYDIIKNKKTPAAIYSDKLVSSGLIDQSYYMNLKQDFKELFPQTKVIIQIRENIKAQSKSGWHKDNKNAINYLNKLNKQLIDFFNKNKSFCYLTSFERMFDKKNLRNIFKFINCEEHFNEGKIDEILKNNFKD